MGLSPANPEDFTYVVVPGYEPQTAVDMSQPVLAGQDQSSQPTLLPEYTESLFDWITRNLVSSAPNGGQP
jgi:hypothetical protein